MNKKEILNMPAGREMDALIAENVMGHVVNKNAKLYTRWETTLGYSEGFTSLSYYSTDISAAWIVVEKIVELFGCDVSAENRADIHAHTRVGICKFQYGKLEYDNPNLLLYVFGETVPLAICRAALLAVVPVNSGGV